MVIIERINMDSARCPVCEDIITFGIPLKPNQSVTCPTCLASLQVVSINPFELDVSEDGRSPASIKSIRHNQGKNYKNIKKHRVSDYYGGEDDEGEYEEYDEYLLERRLRYKPDREKRKKSESL